jgi:hypothetical protein
MWKKSVNEGGEMKPGLPDSRLDARLERLVDQLSAALDKSIPQACGSVHETKAAYRFLG